MSDLWLLNQRELGGWCIQHIAVCASYTTFDVLQFPPAVGARLLLQ